VKPIIGWCGTGAAAVLLAAVLWGTTGTAAAFAPGVSSLAIGAAAMGIGGLLQAALAAGALRTHRSALRNQSGTVTFSAVSVAVFPLAFYSSMRLAGVAVGTVVTIGSAPPAAALIERIADGTRLSRRWVTGTAVGVLGVLGLALSHPSRSAGTSLSAGWCHIIGIGLGLIGGATYVFYSWGAARVIRHGVPSHATMGAIFGIGGLLLMPVLLATGSPILTSPKHLVVVSYLALVPMFLGYILFGRGLTTVSASTATTLSLAEPAAAALIAVIVLHEHLTTPVWLGLLLLFASLVITTAPPINRASHPIPAAPLDATTRVHSVKQV
jgi:drug/metabolite transporter, DME family